MRFNVPGFREKRGTSREAGDIYYQITCAPFGKFICLFTKLPLGLAFVLMLRPFIPELVMSTDLLSFEHPPVLLDFIKSRT